LATWHFLQYLVDHHYPYIPPSIYICHLHEFLYLFFMFSNVNLLTITKHFNDLVILKFLSHKDYHYIKYHDPVFKCSQSYFYYSLHLTVTLLYCREYYIDVKKFESCFMLRNDNPNSLKYFWNFNLEIGTKGSLLKTLILQVENGT